MRDCDYGDWPAWRSVDEDVREGWRVQFDDFCAAAVRLGIRIEDDQVPHGPDVAPAEDSAFGVFKDR